MTLSYTSYYGTKGELVKVYNLVEPFTVNDVDINAGTGSAHDLIEDWFGDSWETVYDEILMAPNSLTYQLAQTTNSEIEFESGDRKGKIALRGYYDSYVTGAQPVGNTVRYNFGYTDSYGNLNYQGYVDLMAISGDDEAHLAYTTTYGERTLNGFPDHYSNTARVAILMRDYTGEVFVLSLMPVKQSTYITRFNRIISRGVDRMPEFMDKEFWEGISNDVPETEEGEGIVNINNRFAPRTSMNGLGVYPITRADLQGFVKDLWNESFSEKILKYINGDVMNNIVSVRWFYGIGGSIPRTDASVYIRLGNQSMKGDLGTQTVVTRPAVSELMTYTMGSLLVPRKYNNFLDLSPFTRLQVFVPYVGFVNLDMTEFAGRRLRLDYNINIVSGAAVAYIYVQNSDGSWRIAHEQATTLGVEIPLSINSRESMSNRITTAIAGTAVTAGGAAVGSLLGPVGAIGGAMAGAGVSQSVLSGGAQIASNGISGLSSTLSSAASSRNGGGIDNETGSLGDFQPSILITRPKAIPPSDYNMQVGLPDNNSGTVGSFNGYIKAGAIKQSAVSGLPRQAMDEIDQMLRAGVYTQ